ncbi:MAG: pyridoxamine 5'-phosphate oxidase family protein [Pseudomonadota bacterium]
METIQTIADLEALYDDAVPGSLTKVVDRITPHYKQWIEASRFVVVSTAGAEGTDGSPRGDDGPVVSIADETTLYLPDWRGNNRLDTLRNIVVDGRISLMFMVPGSNNVVRVNGTAKLTADEALCASFDKKGRRPKTVVVISVGEIYFPCAKALMRSALWAPESQGIPVPSAGQFVREIDHDFDAESYDRGYPEYAKPRMW